MIYVVTALYQEAHGFIRELELKKNTAYAPFEVFDNENAGIRLVVTGVGEIAAAAVVAAVCARDGADAADFLINITNPSSIQTPSKLIDYGIAGRPILDVSNEFSDPSLFLKFYEGDYSVRRNIDFLDNYRIENVARQFVELNK